MQTRQHLALWAHVVLSEFTTFVFHLSTNRPQALITPPTK